MSSEKYCTREGLDDDARTLLGALPERWGRMGLMGKTALVEVGRVLLREDMLTDHPSAPTLKPGWTGGLIVASRRGSLAVDIEYAQTVSAGPGMASPHLFSYTLPNIPLAEAAIQYGLTGPVFCIISEAPYEEALREAQHWLEDISGSNKLMVAGALDVIPAGETTKLYAKFKILHC